MKNYIKTKTISFLKTKTKSIWITKITLTPAQ